MKGSVNMGKENRGRLSMHALRRGLALFLAGCMLTGALAACGDKEKDKDQDNNSGASGTASVAPIQNFTPTPPPTAKAVRVEVDDSLNVRKSGSTDAEILGTVNDGDELALLTETAKDGWYQVQYDGAVGYVSADYVKVIDVTVERYNALKGSGSAATAEPGGSSAEPDTGASPDPESSQSASRASNSDNEDGE